MPSGGAPTNGLQIGVVDNGPASRVQVTDGQPTRPNRLRIRPAAWRADRGFLLLVSRFWRTVGVGDHGTPVIELGSSKRKRVPAPSVGLRSRRLQVQILSR